MTWEGSDTEKKEKNWKILKVVALFTERLEAETLQDY